jgi:hypothetical protein
MGVTRQSVMKRPPQPRIGAFAPARKRIGFVVALAVLLLLSFLAITIAGEASRTEQQKELLSNLPDSVRLLYALGDLNGDGQVDRQDLALLSAMVSAGSATPPAAVKCVAAGDLDLDGKIDRNDLGILSEWLKDSPRVKIPALYWQPTLACGFIEPFLAATIEPGPGDPVEIRFLDPSYTASNSTVTVQSGPISITKASDGKRFSGKVSPKAHAGQRALLMLTLPGNRQYFLAIDVATSPER